MLDPEGIEERLLEPNMAKVQTKDFPSSQTEYHKLISYLTDTSMIEKNRDDGKILVHRLVQDVTRARMAKLDGLLSTAFEDAINKVTLEWPFLNRNYVTGSAGKVDRWTQCAVIFPHILHFSEIYKELRETKSTPLPCLKFAELLVEAVQ